MTAVAGRAMKDSRAQRFQPAAYPRFLRNEDGPQPACRGVPIETFFPGHGRRTTEAKQICARCPLRDRCREWALSRSTNELYGIWGGLSRDDRIAIRARRRSRP